jgi:hypothetical protein
LRRGNLVQQGLSHQRCLTETAPGIRRSKRTCRTARGAMLPVPRDSLQ